MSLKSIGKLKGRSFKELRFRGEQFLHTTAEQIGWSGNLPDEAELWKSLQTKTRENRSPQILLENFRRSVEKNFFAPFADKDSTIKAFEKLFTKQRQASIINRAERQCTGKFHILGYEDLYFGSPVDWLFHPISGKRFPLEHWKAFQNLPVGDDNDWRITFELNRHQHFFHLGAAYWLTGDEKFATSFVGQISGWMKQNPPQTGVNWSSSLEVGMRAVSWTWALAFFRDSENLTEEVFTEILQFISAHARHLSKYLSVYFSPDNHLTGEAFALYTLGTIFEDFGLAAEWRKTGRDILLRELERQILPDGSYFGRSTFYHRYTTEFYLQFLLLALRRGEKISIIERIRIEGKIKLMLDYLLFLSQPDGTTLLIGDDDGGGFLPFGKTANNDFRPLLSVGAAFFEREDYKYIAEKYDEKSFWLLGANGAEVFRSLNAKPPSATCKSLSDGGLFVVRKDWSKEAEVLIINSGETQTDALPHAHADALSFTYTFDGKPFLVENGTYSYYENHNVRDYFRSSEAHNTLTVDEKSSSAPADIFKWRTFATPHTKNFFDHSRFTFFEGEMQAATPANAAHRRSILHLHNDYWLMHDSAEMSGTHRYDLNLHFAPEVETERIESDGENSLLVLRNDDAELHIVSVVEDGKCLCTGGWHSSQYGFKTLSEMCRITSFGTDKQDFFTFFLPVRQKAFAYEVEPLESNNGRAFAINGAKTEDVFIYSNDAPNLNKVGSFTTDFRFVWARFTRDTRELQEMVLVGGRNLTYKGRELITSPDEISHAAAQKFGRMMEFRLPDDAFRISLPNDFGR